MDEYTDGQIEEFRRYYEEICKLNMKLNKLRVGDVFVDKTKIIVPGSLRTIKRYKEKVPAKFKEEFNFNVRELEEKILKL